jgi:tetratricopeptide (TPR) repeat protein
MTRTASGPRLRGILPAVVLIVLGVVCYANSFRNEFVWDENFEVLQNRFLRSWDFVPRFFTTDLREVYGSQSDFAPIYRPVKMLAHFVDYQLWQANPVGFHLTNLLLHLANGLLLLALLGTLGVRGELRLLAAAIFICHPLQTEAVTFITSRATEFATLFQLLALLLFLRKQLCAAAVAFGLGLLSKEIALIFPLVLVLASWLVPAARPRRQTEWIRYALAFGLVLAAYVLTRALVLHLQVYTARTPAPLRGLLFFNSLATATSLTVFPVKLHMERSLPTSGWQSVMLTAAGAAIVTGLIVLGRWFYQRDRRVVFGLTLFGISFFSVSGLIPLNASFAEAWLYWPLIGVLIALSAGFDFAIGRNPRLLLGILAAGWVAVAALSVATIIQNRVWRNETVLYETIIARGGGTARIHANLGLHYRDVGNHLAAQQHLETALKQNPRYSLAMWGLGTLMTIQHNYAAASNWFAEALVAEPANGQAAIWLAYLQERDGNLPAAELTLTTAADRSPFPTVSRNLANFHYRHGRLTEAELVLREVLARDPLDAAAHNLLGTVLFRNGNLAGAEEQFRLALRYDYWMIDAYANLAAVADARGDFEQALQHYQRALKLAPRNASLYYAMGVVLNRHGQSAEARQALKRAVELDPGFDEAKKLLQELTGNQ